MVLMCIPPHTEGNVLFFRFTWERKKVLNGIFFLYLAALCLLLRHTHWTRIPRTHGT